MTDHGLRVALVGGTGRVGGALAEALGARHRVRLVDRSQLAPDAIAALPAALTEADVLVNAAGVAHVDRAPAPRDVARLVSANVLLPLELAEACLEAKTPFVHVSSSKAASRDRTAYAWSKRAGEDVLSETLHDRFAAAGVPLVIVRPPALLFPPFDAGKLRWFRGLDRVPARLTPPLRLPVVTPDRFVARIEELLVEATRGVLAAGVSTVDFDRAERGSMTDVRAAVQRARAMDRPD